MTERVCPICESRFTPKAISSLTCGAACSNKAKKLRSAMKAFNAGKRDLRPATLEQAMRLLEADEIISASKDQRKAAEVLDDEVDDPAEDQRWRNAYAAEQAMQRKWMADWRAAKLRMIARGRRPMWATPRMIEQANLAHPGGLPPLT